MRDREPLRPQSLSYIESAQRASGLGEKSTTLKKGGGGKAGGVGDEERDEGGKGGEAGGGVRQRRAGTGETSSSSLDSLSDSSDRCFTPRTYAFRMLFRDMHSWK